MTVTTIGTICNYYGGLSVKAEGGRYYWVIEGYDSRDWEEIPERLYRALMRYEVLRRLAEIKARTADAS